MLGTALQDLGLRGDGAAREACCSLSVSPHPCIPNIPASPCCLYPHIACILTSLQLLHPCISIPPRPCIPGFPHPFTSTSHTLTSPYHPYPHSLAFPCSHIPASLFPHPCITCISMLSAAPHPHIPSSLTSLPALHLFQPYIPPISTSLPSPHPFHPHIPCSLISPQS